MRRKAWFSVISWRNGSAVNCKTCVGSVILIDTADQLINNDWNCAGTVTRRFEPTDRLTAIGMDTQQQIGL